MENVCKKCGNNLYGNKMKCPFCGHPIGSSVRTSREQGRSNNYSYNNQTKQNTYQKPRTRNTYSYNKGPRSKTSTHKLGFVEILVLLTISFFVPPLGFIFFLAYSKDKSNFATLALIIGIVGVIYYLN